MIAWNSCAIQDCSKWSWNDTTISSFVFIDLLYLSLTSFMFFLFRALKDFQGYQESLEREAQGSVSFNQWQSFDILSHSSSFFYYCFQSTFQTFYMFLHCIWMMMLCLMYIRMRVHTTVHWYGRPLNILIVHSVTSLDYGALFSQTLVCFGSGFDQAVLLRCQGPFVKLESKQL